MAEVKDKVVTAESLKAKHDYDETTYLKKSGALSTLGITATAAELNKLDGVTATATEINKLAGLTATTAELNYVDGVTNNIQTQLNGKAASNHIHSGTSIPNGANLNNYKTVGTYYANEIKSDTYSVVNAPSAMGDSTFVLEVLPASGGGSIIQRVTRTAYEQIVVTERAYYGDEWGDWHTVSVSGMRVLWEGVYHMGSGQVANFLNGSLLSEQNSGIVLVWSGYSTSGGEAADSNFQFTFVPKRHAVNHSGCGVVCTMATASFSKVGVKYVYVADDKITGHASNNTTGSGSGITFDNTYFVLRYVLSC